MNKFCRRLGTTGKASLLMKLSFPLLFFTGFGFFSNFSVAATVSCDTMPLTVYNQARTSAKALSKGRNGVLCVQDITYDDNTAFSTVSSKNLVDDHYRDKNGDLISVSVSASAQARSNKSGLSVSGGSTEFGYPFASGSVPHARAHDTFTVTVNEEQVGQVLPVRSCAKYQTKGSGTVNNRVTIGVSANGGTSTIPNLSAIGTYGSVSNCTSGEIVFNSAGLYIIKGEVNLVVSGHYETVETSGTPIIKQSGIGAGSLSIDASGFDCVSSSGDAAGCELPPIDPEEEVDNAIRDIENTFEPPQRSEDSTCSGGTNALVGNPINFLYGYKLQRELDYQGGMLALRRIYRSDKNWTNEYFGARWHHSYDRKLTFTTNGATTNAELITATGKGVYFSNSGNGWTADFPDTTERFNDDGNGGYIFTDTDNTKEFFNALGQLTRIEYINGQSVNLAYSDGKLSTVTDEQSNVIGFTYNANNQITKITTPTGDFLYGYTGENLTSVTKPDSTTRNYHYENPDHPHALTGITDENGVRYSTYFYDNQGRAIRSEHVGGVDDYDITYHDDGRVTTTNPLGKQTTYHFQTIHGLRKITQVEGHESTNCAAANKNYTYNANGWLETKTDWSNNITLYERNARGLVTRRIKPENQITTYSYHSDLRLPVTITQDKKQTSYTYLSDGRVESMTVTDTATSQSRTTTYIYDPSTKRLIQIDGPRTDVSDITTFEYNPQGRLFKTTNALGHSATTLSFDNAGRPTLSADANGVQTSFTYDAQGRVLQTIADVGGIAATTKYGYTPQGDLSFIQFNDDTQLISYSYDQARNLTGITYGYPSSGTHHSIIYTRDAAGNVTQIEYKDADTTLYLHNQAYDELSRLLSQTNALGQITAYSHDVNNNMTGITDAENNTTTFAFDALQRHIETIDTLNNSAEFAYNDLNQNTDVTDQRGNATHYEFNAFGEVTQETSPDRGIIRYTHNQAGNVTEVIDGRGVVTRYEHDALNRRTAVIYPSDPSLDIEYIYDDLTTCPYSLGRLCKVKDASGETTYTVDALGRITVVNHAIDGLGLFHAYAHDDGNNIFAMLYPSARELVFDYTGNQQGNIVGVYAGFSGTHNPIATNIEYLPFGDVTSMDFANGLTLYNSYNQAYRLTNKTVSDGTVDLLNWSYTHNAAGHITGYSDKSFALDPLYRLLNEVNTGNTITYALDEVGNRTRKDAVNYVIAPTSNRMTAINGTTVEIDAGGYITRDEQGRNYNWNAAGQLESIEENGVIIARYIYNAANQRVMKTLANGDRHYYVYNLNGELISEWQKPSGEWARLHHEYIHLNGQPLAVFDADNTVTYLHTDHLGTPRYGTNAAKSVVWHWDSNAFGNNLDSGINPETMPLRFAGQYYDTESGLHYNWHRYYDPQTGRYISSDPIGLAGGLNTYGYALQNPIMLNDPMGLTVVYDCPSGKCTAAGLPLDWARLILEGLTSNSVDCVKNGNLNSCAWGAAELICGGIVGKIGGKALGALGARIGDVAKSAENYVDLASSQRRRHILDGDATGGGHRPGTGKPGKSEFPQGWSDDKIMHEISDIATDPNAVTRAGRGRRTITQGTRDGIDIEVIQERNGDIVSGYPTNVLRNPR